MTHWSVARRIPTIEWMLLSIGLLGLLWQPGISRAQSSLPDEFVYLRDIDPTISQDIKYAGADNFVGRPLPGYEAGECVLRRPVAQALRRVQRDLVPRGLSLKVHDCYRPVQAVQAMADWVSEAGSGEATKRFFPQLDKSRLVLQGYIASRSAHSRGIAVDLTLIRAPSPPRSDPHASNRPCTESPQDGAARDDPDMGTSFDCFDVRSHSASPLITPDQRSWRAVLERAMAEHGFKNYRREWWHFTYRGSFAPEHYDFPIRPRASR
jgi:zinc D-Ala-D-Ala dipeptidase